MSQKSSGKYILADSAKQSRRTRGWKRNWWLLPVAVLAVACVLLGGYFLMRRTDPLCGHWQIDDVTSYRFDGHGQGALVVQDKEYPFRYTATGAELTLDFEEASAKDTTYRYTKNGNSLTLEVGAGEEETQYILTQK